MFETLTRDIATRFHLGDKAPRFVRLLVDALFDDGGLAGVRERFERAQLGPLFQSWVGATPADDVLQADQFVSGVGQGTSERIAATLGLEPAQVNAAGAYALPKIIGLLSRGGTLPATRPTDYDRWFLAAPVAAAAPGATAAPRVETVEPAPSRRRGVWWWLLPLLVLLGLLFAWRGCQRTPETLPAATTATAPASTSTDPRFEFANDAGKINVSGQLASDADKRRLMDALAAAFGAANVSGDIAVDAATRPARWLDCVVATGPTLRQPGLKYGFAGDRLHVDSAGMPESDRFAVTRALRQGCTGYRSTGFWDRAAAAFAQLKPGYHADQLVAALNLMDVYFDTDSAAITADSEETLTQAAAAIKGAPAGTRIEVGGHTDSTGDAAHNLELSQRRADAVAAKLAELGVDGGVLTSKGYGATKPKADNGTDEGRAQNRRMEFTVLK